MVQSEFNSDTRFNFYWFFSFTQLWVRKTTTLFLHVWTIHMRRNKNTVINPSIGLVKEKSYFLHVAVQPAAACHVYFLTRRSGVKYCHFVTMVMSYCVMLHLVIFNVAATYFWCFDMWILMLHQFLFNILTSDLNVWIIFLLQLMSTLLFGMLQAYTSESACRDWIVFYVAISHFNCFNQQV
jgi:hypothetical protein